VPVEETYRTEDIFASREDFYAEISAVDSMIPSLSNYRGRLHEDATVVYECLETLDEIARRASWLVSYSRLRLLTDGGNPEYTTDVARAMDVQSRMLRAASFVKTELCALTPETLQEYIQTEPRLNQFSSLLRQVDLTREHMLGLEAETTLAALSQLRASPSQIYGTATTADMKFEPVLDSQGKQHSVSLMGVMMHTEVSPDTTLRRNAYASMINALKPYRHTLAASLSTHIKANVTVSRLKRYESVFHMMLNESAYGFGSADEVPVSVFDNVLDTFQAKVSPEFQRYAKLRQRVLGLDRLLIADVKAGLDPDYDPSLNLEDVEEWIVEAVETMGPDYVDTVRSAFKNRWIDRADNYGRQGGASCTTVYGLHPFIFSVWTGSMHSAFTLAHELGHAVHGVLNTRHQRFLNTRSSQFLGEAPSCFIPQLLAEHLKSTAPDTRFRRAVLIEEMNTYHHEFVTHLLEAELLRRLYRRAERGEALPEKIITGEKRDILRQFWGDTVEVDDDSGLMWMRQPHYYMGLYPYVYSVGLAAATCAIEIIKEEGEPAKQRWLDMMKAGGSKNALALFKMVGIDMSTPEPLERMCEHVGKVVTELEDTF